MSPPAEVTLPNCSAPDLDPTLGPLCMFVTGYIGVPAGAPCPLTDYMLGGVCTAYPSAASKAAILLGGDAVVDNGSTAWMLSCTAMVMLMIPSIGLFNAGLGDARAAGNTVLMALAALAIVSIQWYLFGYSFVFSSTGSSTMGDFVWGAFTGVSEAPAGAYGDQVPHIIFASFECMVAAFAAAIISGAVVNRMKFTTWCLFVFLWTTIVYDVVAHWFWAYTIDPTSFAVTPLGWLINGQHSGVVVLDYMGGIVVCTVSGTSALAAAIVLGPRKTSTEPPKAHDVPLVLLGATMLWFGWLGFAGGSALSAKGQGSEAFWNSHVAASCGALSWMLTEKVAGQKATPMGAGCGAVTGLVALASGAGFVSNWAAVVIAWLASPLCFAGTKLKARFNGPDDTLDTSIIYGLGGIFGAFCTGIFADPSISGQLYGTGASAVISTYGLGAVSAHSIQIGFQLAGVIMAVVYSFTVSFGLLMLLKVTVGLRIPEDLEVMGGIDTSEHGGGAYYKKGLLG